MKRTDSLTRLSHDHHDGLVVAKRITAGLRKEASPVVMREFVAHFWETGLVRHFALEEELLIPVLREIDAGELERELVGQHAAIRALVTRITAGEGDTNAELQTFTTSLKDHIRFEERTLFPFVEEHAPADRLETIGTRLNEEDPAPGVEWGRAFWE